MKKHFKVLASVLSVIMTIAIVAGCSVGRGRLDNNVGSDYDVELNVDKNITAKLTIGVENYTAEKKIAGEIGDLLTKYYPNVTVEIKPFSGSLSSTVSGWYNANAMPDIFINNSFDMFTLSDKNIMLDLTPYIQAEADETTEKNPDIPFNIDDYYDSYIKMGQENFDGAQYMMPRSADRVVCQYNVQIFKAAGVDMSLVKNGWTWDDFKQVCATLRAYYDANGKENNHLIDSYFTWEAVYNPIFEHFGVTYIEDSVAAINNDQTQEALDFIKSFIDERYVAPFSTSTANMAGGVGCILFHSQCASNTAASLAQNIDTSSAEKVSDYFNVVTMPVFSGDEKIGCGAAGYSVYSGSTNRDLAWIYLKLLMSKEGQNVMADSGSNYVPVRKDMADYTDPENHWGIGYEDLNLSAYTYNPEWNCYTTYIAKAKPKQASNISNEITKLISSYCAGTAFSTAANNCENNINRFIKM